MPNVIRNKVFTELALETTKDSIKYLKPYFSKSANGHPLNDRSPDFNGFNDQGDEDYDPWGYSDGGEFNGDDYRKALYEETRDRFVGEFANAVVTSTTDGTVGTAVKLTAGTATEVAVLFKQLEAGTAGVSQETIFESGKWGKDGALYVDGYTYIYGVNPGDSSAKVEQQVIAIQDKGSGQFFAAPGFTVEMVKSPTVRDKFLNSPVRVGPGNSPYFDAPMGTDGTVLGTSLASTGVLVVKITPSADVATAAPWFKEGETTVAAYGRFNSESDFEGNHLGEVEIRMAEYNFKPSPTSIGVSWSQLTEITLDTSFNVSAEESLISYASQEIRAALDYRAIRLAYAYAKTNARHNKNYLYEFEADYNTAGVGTNPAGTKEGYIANAQTFVSAIDAIGDVIYDEFFNRLCIQKCIYQTALTAGNPLIPERQSATKPTHSLRKKPCLFMQGHFFIPKLTF